MQFLLRRLGVEPGEAQIFFWSAATLFLIGWSDVSVENASMTLFLDQVSEEWLPVAFLVSASLLTVTTYLAARFASEADRPRMLPRVLVGLALALVPMWVLVLGGSIPTLFGLLIVSKQLEALALLFFWLTVTDLLHGRQAKRLFAPLLSGLTLGTALGSFASKPIGDLFGLDRLLLLSSVGFLAAAATALPLRKLAPARLRSAAETRTVASVGGLAGFRSGLGLRNLMRESWLFRLLFTATACSALLGPMLYFQFAHVARVATEGDDSAGRLLALFSAFRGWLGLGILAAQILATTRLYRWIGVPLSAALSPLIYLLGFVGLSVRLSLVAGVAAKAGTELNDKAVYDPALRVLYNLLPGDMRARGGALLEGPVKRAASVLGNVVTLVALWFGSAVFVGYAALPIASVWLLATLVIWRAYPFLLMQAPLARRAARGEISEDALDLLDGPTLRGLAPHLRSDDPERVRVALALIGEGDASRAVPVLSAAAREASSETRPLIVDTLDLVLERAAASGQVVTNAAAAADVVAVLESPESLSDVDRADLVQAYGRLTVRDPEAACRMEVFERALAHPAPAVRLASLAALHARGLGPPDIPDLDPELERAVASVDDGTRKIAREELRARLLQERDERWSSRLKLVLRLLDWPDDRSAVAEVLADVARVHGEAASEARQILFSLPEGQQPCFEVARLHYAARVGLIDEAPRMVRHLTSEDEDLAEAARGGLLALGPGVADVLLRELSYGARSRRNALLLILREIQVETDALRAVYDRELELVRRSTLHLAALEGDDAAALVAQRLEERAEEGIHTALLLLAALRDDDRLCDLADRLRLSRGSRQRAVLIEALESVLGSREEAELMPLLDERGAHHRARAAARALKEEVPSAEESSLALRKDSDFLTRTLAEAISLKEARGMHPAEVALELRSIPLFEGLSARELFDLARTVREVKHPTGTKIVEDGAVDACMYLIVQGRVEVRKGETRLAELGSRDFFGEAAVIEGTPRNADVVALSETRLLVLDREDFFHLMEDHPTIAISICQTLSRRVRELNERVRAKPNLTLGATREPGR